MTLLLHLRWSSKARGFVVLLRVRQTFALVLYILNNIAQDFQIAGTTCVKTHTHTTGQSAAKLYRFTHI